jgi:glycosyltransferase involved in cell wall biosynthesis
MVAWCPQHIAQGVVLLEADDDMSKPTVSVVTPTYNRAHLIGRALRSVLSQSFQDFEVLVMDDASTDDTAAVVRAFSDARIQHVHSEHRLGPAAQRNRGMARARGEFVAFQDSDDEWLLDKLEKQVQRLRELPEEVAVTQCAVLRHETSGYVQRLANRLPRGREGSEVLRNNANTFTQAWLARKDALLSMGGFDESIRVSEDWEFLIRICQRFGFDCDERVLCIVYESPGSLVHQNDHRLQGMERILEIHRSGMDRYPEMISRNLYVLGRFHLMFGSAGRGRTLLIESIRKAPTNPRAWVLLGLSLAGTAVLRSIVSAVDKARHARPVPT